MPNNSACARSDGSVPTAGSNSTACWRRITIVCLLICTGVRVCATEMRSYPTSFLINGYGGTASFSLRTSAETFRSARGFSARFNDSLWLVRFTGTSKDLDYVEMGTDGTNIFTVLSTESLYKQAQSQGRPLQNSASGTVTRGPVPKELAHPHAGLLWFAFASAGYLRPNGSDSLPPLMLAEANSDILLYFGFKQNAELEPWSKADPRPRRAVWFHDGIIRDWAQRDFAVVSAHRERRRKPPFDRGFTNAIFEATQFTNVGPYSLPLRLDYWVFTPKVDGKVNTDLALLQHHWLSVTNVTLGRPQGSFVPRPPDGATLVGDKRFAVKEGNFASVSYMQTNVWLTDDEAAKLLAKSKIQKTSQLSERALKKDVATHPSRISRSRIIPLTIILIPTVIFLGFFFAKQNRKQKGII